MERRPWNPKNIYLKLSGLSRSSYSSSPFPPFKCPTLYIYWCQVSARAFLGS